ncbi:hypothetical protein GUJ93_ZPchr1933g22903 [Zizania palustris]|uniref:Pentacotripeptide-repeat region of PRORP domain-containing protein n=1 Tax=Zizania palustris TaxID=103762 RepID=A0A8J5VHT8_ZIZPA|nr:hypothetical protein GUJ93_ZPchr1933g22903 [Zizania palustris]
MSRRRLSSILASSSSSASSTASTSAPAKLVCALPPAYAVFKERLLSGTLGPDDARHLFDEVLLDCDLAKAPNALLSALARAPPSAAPNGYTYNILIDCYRRAHRPDLGLAIFGRLLKTGFGLNVVAYSTVIDSFFKEGEVDKAYDIFCEMKKQGISPNVVTYNSTIDGLCKSKAMDKAEKVLQQMLDAGVQPDNITYSSLINGYSSLGMWKESVRTFKDMSNSGLTPCVISCNSFMHALCKRGRIKEAKCILIQWLRMARNLMFPATVFFFMGMLLRAALLMWAGRTNTAKKIFHEMIDCGMAVNNDTYSIVLNGLCRNNCTDEAIMLLDKLFAMNIKNDVVIFTTMISAMFKVGRREEAKQLFAAISTYGLVPDIYTYA